MRTARQDFPKSSGNLIVFQTRTATTFARAGKMGLAFVSNFGSAIRLGVADFRLPPPPYPRSMIILAALAAVTVVPDGKTFNCTPIRVWDGDGPIWCAEGPRVRLAGIATRETDGACRKYQPCPKIAPQASRDSLVRLIGKPTGKSPEGHVKVTGPTMRCLSDGNAKGNRTAAWCKFPIGGDISCAMVRGGWAAKWKAFWRNHRCS